MSPATPRNWGRIALVSVLVLSLLGNAVTLGAALRLRHLRNELLGPQATAAVYPPETRKALRAAFAAKKGQLLPGLHELVAMRAQIVADAQQRPFDRPRLEAEMTALRSKATDLFAQAQGIYLDTLEAQSRE